MNIPNILNTILSHLRSGMRQDPVRNWFVLLTLSLFAFICVVVWNVWAFDTVSQGGVIGATTNSTVPIIDRTAIDAIHAIFEKRAAEEAKYATGVYRYADPSQ